MSVIVQCAQNDGMDSYPVSVECCYMKGFNGVSLIGHVGEVCRSGVERAKGALEALGITFPQRKIAISLSPADIKKDGSQFDLAMAVGLLLLLTDGESEKVDVSEWLFAAELGLNGALLPVKNIVSYAVAGMTQGIKGVIVATQNLPEIEVLCDIKKSLSLSVAAFSNLSEVQRWLMGEAAILRSGLNKRSEKSLECSSKAPNFDDMVLSDKMQDVALTIASGHHNLLMYGTPGTGKSMFSERLPSIFTPMQDYVHLQALKIHSCASSEVAPALLSGIPCFRAPHHQASPAAILGIPETPGEISLAHGGILFLDELPEFRRDIIESLREPLETGRVRVSRARRKVSWAARAILVAACNLCPCGWFSSKVRKCTCPTSKVLAYRHKLSGPVLDRIDLHINMEESLPNRSIIFQNRKKNIKSLTDELRAKVNNAVNFAVSRNAELGCVFNSELSAKDMIHASGLSEGAFYTLIEKNIPKSATFRSTLRTLRVARTLADLKQEKIIGEVDLEKAWGWQMDTAAKERGDFALGL